MCRCVVPVQVLLAAVFCFQDALQILASTCKGDRLAYICRWIAMCFWFLGLEVLLYQCQQLFHLTAAEACLTIVNSLHCQQPLEHQGAAASQYAKHAVASNV